MNFRALAVFFLVSCPAIHSAEPAAAPSLPPGLYAEISTPRGALTCELFFEQAPLTVANFVGLAEGTLGPLAGKPYFEGLKFHRVAPDFVVQGGDPLGTGEGGPGYTFPDEFVPGLRHERAGMLSMANSGPDTNGSQFFITLREVNRLNYLHSVFGRVIQGIDVVPRIRQRDAMAVRIIRQGSAAQSFRTDPAAFATLIASAVAKQTPTANAAKTYFEDVDRLLPEDPPRAPAFNLKLTHFAQVNGVDLHARLFARSPPDSDGRKINAHLRDFAEKLGVLQHGALLIYFADRQEWKLWIGENSTAAFMGRAGTVKDFMQDGALHQAKQDFIAAARAQADAAADRARGTSNLPLSSSQMLKHQVDALLDLLIFKLEPKS